MTRGFSFSVPLTSRHIKEDSVCLHVCMKTHYLSETASVCVCRNFCIHLPACWCTRVSDWVGIGALIQQCDGTLSLMHSL